VTRVKICGLTDIDTAIAAAEAGADLLGLVFAPSRRRVTPEAGRAITAAIRTRKLCPLLVGVFVNLPAGEVNRTAAFCGLDRVQLSGEESWAYCRRMELPVIKTVHVPAGADGREITRRIAAGRYFLGAGLTCLLDTAAPGAHGGTGRRFDWRIAREAAARFPVIIAGGLDAESVGQLVREVRPWGVDVASGVETAGSKDTEKIRAFIAAVRRAEAATAGGPILSGEEGCGAA